MTLEATRRYRRLQARGSDPPRTDVLSRHRLCDQGFGWNCRYWGSRGVSISRFQMPSRSITDGNSSW